MKTTVSSKGQIVLPAEIRQLDRIEPEQEFDIERLDRGEYRLIRRTPRPNDGAVDWKKRTALEHWFDAGVQRLHCLPWEAGTGLKWAELLARLRTTGTSMPIKDSLIAATALAHRLTVATHNRAGFEPAGVPLVDPFLR